MINGMNKVTVLVNNKVLEHKKNEHLLFAERKRGRIVSFNCDCSSNRQLPIVYHTTFFSMISMMVK